jgi:hypothetical protein
VEETGATFATEEAGTSTVAPVALSSTSLAFGVRVVFTFAE